MTFTETRIICDELLADHPAKVPQTHADPEVLLWWVGQAMKRSELRASPHIAKAIFRARMGI